MTKPQRDPIREERIHNEVVVDAYGPEEQAMGWYYYLEDKIRFPFQAKWVVAKVVSPLLKGETVEVQGMAPEDACSADMLVLIRWQGRSMAVPLSQLLPIKRDKATNEAIADWHCQFGTCGNGVILSPGVVVLHAQLMKNYLFSERGPTLRLYLKASNVLNHPNWANPGVDFSSPQTFGVITNVGGANSSFAGDSPAPDPSIWGFG